MRGISNPNSPRKHEVYQGYYGKKQHDWRKGQGNGKCGHMYAKIVAQSIKSFNTAFLAALAFFVAL
jgi:hypothetical protein